MTTEEKESLYNKGIENINSIYEIFKDYFGEERVDLQRIADKKLFIEKITGDVNNIMIGSEYYPYIIVHFPKVTVTNEFNDSVNIEDLWAKVIISYNGTLYCGFTLNRSTYPESHWCSDYMHSHIPGIPKHNISIFQNPCLGRGPIRDTISSLCAKNCESLWMLFCRELDVYTKTESISGGPYRRISNIGTANYSSLYAYGFQHICRYDYSVWENPNDLKDFIICLLNKNVLKFNYCNGAYGIAMDWYDYYLILSNVFIEWYNNKFNKKEVKRTLSELIALEILIPVEIKNGKFYKRDTAVDNQIIQGSKILTFKGNDVYLRIVKEDTNTHISYILNSIIINNILRALLATVNYKYGKTGTSNDTSRRCLV